MVNFISDEYFYIGDLVELTRDIRLAFGAGVNKKGDRGKIRYITDVGIKLDMEDGKGFWVDVGDIKKVE